MKKYLDDYFADGKALINAGFSLRDAARILRLTCPFDITQVGWEKLLSRKALINPGLINPGLINPGLINPGMSLRAPQGFCA